MQPLGVRGTTRIDQLANARFAAGPAPTPTKRGRSPASCPARHRRRFRDEDKLHREKLERTAHAIEERFGK